MSSDDDDDSDDDFVKQFAGRSVFAKRPKVETTPNLTQSSVETEPSPSLSQEAIEEQAQKILHGMQFPIVQRIHTLQDIGWRKSSSKRRAVIYPCIRLPQDEARLMFPKLVESKIPIRYLGWRWKDATAWEQVVPSTFCPLLGGGGGNSRGGGQDDQQQPQPEQQQDEDYLQQFLDQECGTVPSVARRVEELVIRGCWSKVQENQQKHQDKQRQEQEILEKLKAIPKSQSSKDDHSSLLSTKDYGANNDKDDNDAENDVDDDNEGMDSLLSPNSKRKRVLLRPGDIVEYYLPGRVFGNPDVLCQSKIIGINPKGSFPLNLESGDFLDPDQKVRRLAKVYKGKLVPDTEGVFRAVREFSLRTAGTKQLVGFQNKVRQIAQSKQDFAQSMDEFWQQKETTERPKEEGPSKDTNTKKSESNTTTSTTSPIQTSKDETALPAGNRQSPTYCNLLQQLKQVENDMKTKRRYVPRITPDEFRLIIQAWTLLQQRLGPAMRDEQAIEIWVEELAISEMRLEAILAGDPQKKLSERKKLEILKGFQQWITKTEGPKTEFVANPQSEI